MTAFASVMDEPRYLNDGGVVGEGQVTVEFSIYFAHVVYLTYLTDMSCL